MEPHQTEAETVATEHTYNPVTVEQQRDLDNRFTYHAPFGDQAARYTQLRSDAKRLATQILQFTPASREQSLALTHLETAIFFANAAIARHESLDPYGA